MSSSRPTSNARGAAANPAVRPGPAKMTVAPNTAPGTKLRVGTAPFVPSATSKGAKAPPSTGEASSQQQHADPVSVSTPPQQSSTPPTLSVKPPTPSEASARQQPPTPDSTPTPVSAFTNASPNAAAQAAATGAETPSSQPNRSPLTQANQSSQQEDELPPAAPADWSESKLPVLFGCHNTSAMATRGPMPFNCAWELYADDHSGANTPQTLGGATAGAVSFEPVLVSTVADVESFWRLWRYMPPPSSCPIPFTYSWFRKDVKPEWEHPRNKKGGTITIVIFDRDRTGLNDKQILDDAFMATLLGCVGESFSECTTTLNGLMLKLRPNKPFTMQVWTAHSEVSKLKAFSNSLRETLTKVMGSKPVQKLEYYSHHQKQSNNNSLAFRMKKVKISPDHTF